MWIEIGHFSAHLALWIALIQGGAGLLGGWLHHPAWTRVGRQASYAVFLLLAVASASLVISFLNHDFSVRYVATHSSTALPLFYLATAMWGGHEGSLLLWVWLLSLLSALAVARHWRSHPESMPWVLMVLGLLIAGFLLLVLFLSSPFERLIPPPGEGRDLNPLLQDPGMVFHPPFLYLGYVGFAVPYAFAIAALIRGQVDEEWILATRRWTLFAWAMLTTGIIFGAYWAYYELGWGGYWAWDPVENASFMPWLTGTAFLHSVMAQERRKMFKTWNLFLIVVTFSLSLLGTFLVRSGVLSSVHAFATDPGRGVYILIFMSVVLITSFGLLIYRSDELKSPIRLESLLSRESSFLFNNLFLLVGMVTVLLGTLYPLAVETLSDAKVTVGAPYYNKVFIPIMLGLLFLMAIGPTIPWRKTVGLRLKKLFLKPLLFSLVLGGALSLFFSITHPYGIVSLFLIVFVLISHGQDILSGIKIRQQRENLSLLKASTQLILRNKRRYGGMVVHFGILLMVAGFVGSGLFSEEKNVLLKAGDRIQIGDWHVVLEKVTEVAKDNWQADEGVFRAQSDDEKVTLRPQQRLYTTHAQPTTEAAIHSNWLEDLYIVLSDPVGEGWGVRIYRNPLVSWIWWGSLLMGLGVILALGQGRGLRGR
ncbi:heme lyase CcmF/NrfE family subunit [Magnetococcales bacterium HHB-1]